MGAVRMAWRNLWRIPRRTGIVLAAVAVGISGVVLSMAIYNGMILQMVEAAIASELGHLQVHAPGFDRNPLLRLRLGDGGHQAVRVLGDLPGVQAFARRVRSEGLVSSARAHVGVRVVGIEPEAEARVTTLANDVVRGVYLDGVPRRLLLGDELARRLHVDVGSKVVVSVQDLTGDLTGEAFRVGGIFRSSSGERERGTVFLQLAESQRLFGLGEAVSEVVVLARDVDGLAGLQQTLREELGPEVEVQTWEELRPFLVQIVRLFDQTGWTIYAAVFVAMMFGIANVLLMSVFERTREIGIVLALGMRPRGVVAVLVIEALLLTFLGLALGYAVAAGAVFFLRGGIDLSLFAEGLAWMGMPSRIVPVIRTYDLVVPISVAFITAGLASLWPALRAARLRPAEAMRHV
ncbi:MAG: FtsX-like permease family protein [Myxococcota bacterium]